MTLEEEIEELRIRLDVVAELLRVRRVVEAFPAAPILAGDFFEVDGDPCKLFSVTNDDNWNVSRNGRYFEGAAHYERTHGRRLYTHAEVRAIVTRAREDAVDNRLADERVGEPTVPWEDVKKKLDL